LVLIFMGILFPIIDSLIIKPIQIEQQISILTKINEFEKVTYTSDIEQRLRLDILSKAEKLIEKNQVSINLATRYNDDPWKFYSGVIFWLFVLIAFLFQKQKWYIKIGSFIMLIIIILGIGAIGLLLPTIINPWVNYISYPILQIIFLISLLDLKLEKKKT